MRKTVFLFLYCVMAAVQAQPDFMASNSKGPYDVGLRVVKQYDFTRGFKGKHDLLTGRPVHTEKARPMQTLVWYPAKSGGKQLRYVDYVRSRYTEETFDLPEQRVTEMVADYQNALATRLGADQARAVLNARMMAAKDAQAVAGKFPVVVYAPGSGGTADENADMFEYLASHGYVVVSSTSMGPRSKDMAVYGVEDAETGVADIRFLIGYAQSLPQSDMAHLAVAGWSWGGMNNIFAASRDSRISAVISLDGTREPALTKLIPPQQVTVPWLYAARAPDTIPTINRREIDTSFSLLNEAKYANVHQLTMYPMRHHDFVSANQRQLHENQFGEYSKQEVGLAYSWLVRYVHQFLNAYLKQNPEGLAFINNTPARNGVPRHMIVAETSQAKALPVSRQSFAADLARRGFSKAVQAYREAQTANPNFKLSESELKTWGYGLLARDTEPEAIEIFKLWTVLYPRDWDAFDSLAEAYEQNKDRALAVKNYQRSLELNPQNTSGKLRLQALALGAAK